MRCSSSRAPAGCWRSTVRQVETLASGLDTPVGVAVTADGAVLVSEAGAGRVVRLGAGDAAPVVDGLGRPQGILRPRRHAVSWSTPTPRSSSPSTWPPEHRHTIAAGLPVGPPPGVEPKPLRECRRSPGRRARSPASRPARTARSIVSADAEGSVLAIAGGAIDMSDTRGPITATCRSRAPCARRSSTACIPVGSQLPTEHELCERFSVSRYTVREALRRLRDDNLVSSRPRAGTMVVPRPSVARLCAGRHVDQRPAGLRHRRPFRHRVDPDGHHRRRIGRAHRAARAAGMACGAWDSGRRRAPTTPSAAPSTTSTGPSRRSAGCCRATPARSSPCIEDLFGVSIVEVHQEIAAVLVSPEHAARSRSRPAPPR